MVVRFTKPVIHHSFFLTFGIPGLAIGGRSVAKCARRCGLYTSTPYERIGGVGGGSSVEPANPGLPGGRPSPEVSPGDERALTGCVFG